MLGNDSPKASVVGEIIPGKEFYDYEAKYLSEGSVPVIPAKLSRAQSKQVREMAVAAFRACDLSGLARVDFLMEPGGKQRIFLNEVNTMHAHQHVPQAMGGDWRDLPQPDYESYRAGTGTLRGEKPNDLQPRLKSREQKRLFWCLTQKECVSLKGGKIVCVLYPDPCSLFNVLED